MSSVIQDNRRNLVVILFLFLAVGVFAFSQGGQQGTSFELEGARFILHGPKGFSAEIDLNCLQSIETRKTIETGSCVDGGESGGCVYGLWENEEFGQYHLCKLTDVSACVVMTQENGDVTVFNFENNETTTEFGRSFSEFLRQNGFL